MDIIFLMLFVLSFMFSLLLNAAVIKHEVLNSREKEFEYEEVCKSLGAKDAMLMAPKSLTEMECFNKTYRLIDFCLKKFPTKRSLTRGYVDTSKKKVICEMSDSVMLSVSCDERDAKYCLKPKNGCAKLQKIYAYRLDLAHYSILEKNLNCYFSTPLEESLNEI